LSALVATGAGGCGRDEDLALRQDQQQVLNAFQPIEYHRSGGVAGADDRVTVTRDGKLSANGRFVGKFDAQVSEFQLMALARTFEGWNKLQGSYPSPPGTADAFITEIKFGEKSVTASDASKAVPEDFRRARERLENLVRELNLAR
jgi:hypothetical protein